MMTASTPLSLMIAATRSRAGAQYADAEKIRIAAFKAVGDPHVVELAVDVRACHR